MNLHVGSRTTRTCRGSGFHLKSEIWSLLRWFTPRGVVWLNSQLGSGSPVSV